MLHTLTIGTTFLALILAFTLGIFSVVKNPKSKPAFLWFLTMMAFSIWAVGYLLTLFTSDDAVAAKTIKIVYLGATFVPLFFFHFVAVFLYQDKKFRAVTIFGYITAIAMACLAIATTFVIQGVKYHETFGWHEEVAGIGFYLYLTYFFIFVLLGLTFLVQGLLRSDGIRKRQISFILAASVIAFIGGTSNFMTGLTGIYPYAQMIIWIFPILVTYGVFVQEFRIKIKI